MDHPRRQRTGLAALCSGQYLARLGGDASTTFSGSPVAVPLLEQATRLEFAGGITARVNSSLSFYAQGGYQFAVGDTAGGERQGVSGDLGLRVTW
jgi:outer membrane autotransporter protein